MEYIVIKISGSLTDHPHQLDAISGLVRQYQSDGKAACIIHGGGKQINELSLRLGLSPVQIEGRRVTDIHTLEVLKYTVGGAVNRNIVQNLRSHGISGIGMTGVDAGLTTAHCRAPLQIGGRDIDFGLVGEIDAVDTSIIEKLSLAGVVPVIGCLTWSPNEGILNINADTFANCIAVALKASTMVILMEPESVRGADGRAIARLSSSDFQAGKAEGWITEGMVPKLKTAFEALQSGVPCVRIGNPTGVLAQRYTELITEADR